MGNLSNQPYFHPNYSLPNSPGDSNTHRGLDATQVYFRFEMILESCYKKKHKNGLKKAFENNSCKKGRVHVKRLLRTGIIL
jgi:hypothetical protein